MKPGKKFIRCVDKGILLIVCLLTFNWSSVASAEFPGWPPECIQDQLGSQKILTCLPGNYNGVLLVYVHGYVYPQEVLALPEDEIGALGDVISNLLELGFGFATTSFSDNGYAVEVAEQNLNDLVAHVRTTLAPVPVLKVLLVGASEGALITTMMLEKYPLQYNGGLALCGPLAGMTYQLNYLGDFRVLFDYFFPEVFLVGLDEYNHPFYDTACSNGGWNAYTPEIENAIMSHPFKTLRLFNITRAAFDFSDLTSFAGTAKAVLKYSVCGTEDLVEKADGMPYNNMGRWYHASWWLNRMVDRVGGDAEDYLSHYYDPTGLLEVPLVTLHNLCDPVVPFRHEGLYRQMVAERGKGQNLTVLPTLGYGHCNFKSWQVLGAFYILLDQVSN